MDRIFIRVWRRFAWLTAVAKNQSQNWQTDGANWGHGPQLAHLGHQPFKLAVIGK